MPFPGDIDSPEDHLWTPDQPLGSVGSTPHRTRESSLLSAERLENPEQIFFQSLDGTIYRHDRSPIPVGSDRSAEPIRHHLNPSDDEPIVAPTLSHRSSLGEKAAIPASYGHGSMSTSQRSSSKKSTTFTTTALPMIALLAGGLLFVPDLVRWTLLFTAALTYSEHRRPYRAALFTQWILAACAQIFLFPSTFYEMTSLWVFLHIVAIITIIAIYLLTSDRDISTQSAPPSLTPPPPYQPTCAPPPPPEQTDGEGNYPARPYSDLSTEIDGSERSWPTYGSDQR